MAVFNAACAIYLGIDGLTLQDSVKKAEEMIDSGAAGRKLDEFVEASRSFAEE